MNIKEINLRIIEEICYDTIEQLSDLKLLEEYLKSKSVKKQITKLETILNKYTTDEIKNKITNEYLFDLIPAGTKGVIRGNRFNSIVKNFLINLNLDKNKFDVNFEKTSDKYFTTEIPDWYIFNKESNKIIIGMNQLDIWNGGQQLNRGFKYLYNNIHNTSTSKLLCVIANEIKFNNNKSKAYKLFDIGFSNNTLCYLNNLKNIIEDFFK